MKKILLIPILAIEIAKGFSQNCNNDACSGGGQTPYQLTPGTSCNPVQCSTSGTTQTQASTCSSEGVPGTAADDDVWFKFTATATTHIITADPVTTFDPVIEISTACGGFSTFNCQDDGGNGATETFTVNGLSVGTLYFVRVYSYGTGSQYQGAFTICITTSGGGCTLTGVSPSLNSPGSGSSPGTTISTTTPTLSWNAVSGAGYYGVYVRDMVANVLVVDDDCATTGTSYTVSSGILSNGGQYRWNIIAYQSCGSTCQSNAASPLYFQISGGCTPPSDPTPTFGNTTCTNGGYQTTNPTTLTWNSVSGATGYKVRISEYPYGSANEIYSSSCLTSTSHQVAGGYLYPGKLYRWSPAAYNQSSCTCENSGNPVRYFYLPPTILTGGSTTFCQGSSVGLSTAPYSVNSPGSLSYQWYRDGSAISGATSTVINASQSGNYTVWLTYSGSTACGGTIVLESDPINVTVNPSPTITVTPAQSSVCSGNSIQLSATGATSYNWSPGGMTGATVTVSPSSTTTYTVTGTSNGCSGSSQATVNVSTPTSSITHTDVSCNGGNNGSATVNASGGNPPYTYQWNNGQNSMIANNLTAGNYSVTVTDAASCQTVNSVNILQPSALVGTTGSIEASCGGNDGQSSVFVLGGTEPMTYLWNNGVTSPINDQIPAGNYTVTITDANNCTIIFTVSVGNANGPTVSLSSTNASANGICDGSASATVSGGAPPYNFQWSNGASSQNISTLCAGTYNFSATDANNCTATATVTITQPSPVSIGEQAIGFAFNIYPNPSNGKFIIEFPETVQGNFQLEIFNLIGEKVYSRIATNSKKEEISLPLNPGIYYIKCQTGKLLLLKSIIIEKI